MKEKRIRSEYLMLGCSFIIAFTYLFFQSDAEMSLVLNRVLQFALPIAAVGLFYMAWKTYQDKEQSFGKVILWGVLAMLLAMVQVDHISRIVGSTKVFFVALIPLLAVELIVAAIGKSGLKSAKLLENNEKTRRCRFALWSIYFVLYVGFTVFLGVMWKNDYWQIYHLRFVMSVLFAGFPMICIGLKRWLSSLDFETPMLHFAVYAFGFITLVLLVMWADYGIGMLYMKEEQVNIDRTVYYLILANLIGLNRWSRMRFGKNAGMKKAIFTVCLNIGIFALSPLAKQFATMSQCLSEASVSAAEVHHYNSMIFISNEYGIWPLALITGLTVIVCIALVGWKQGTVRAVNQLPKMMAAGFIIRMILVLIQWYLKVPHVQVPFPFCGTGSMDIAFLVITVFGCGIPKKVKSRKITTAST